MNISWGYCTLYKGVVLGLYQAEPRLHNTFNLILTSPHRTIPNFVSQQSFKPNFINGDLQDGY